MGKAKAEKYPVDYVFPTYEGLPEMCYALDEEDCGHIVIIKRGVLGYFPMSNMQHYHLDETYLKELNTKLGVTIKQYKCMVWGSMFGWNSGFTNPSKYNDDGYFIVPKEAELKG